MNIMAILYHEVSIAVCLFCRAMSTAPGDRKSDVEGTPMGGGPIKGAKEVTGGYLNYAFIVGNLVLAWFGWFLAMCAISALQHEYSNNSEGVNPDLNGWLPSEGVFAGFAINSGYPALPPNRLLRFEW